MITLKTLPDATAQEVFNQVKNHLLTQKKRCADGMICKYRYRGMKCAAGALISDDEYHPSMEGAIWDHLVIDGWVPSQHQSLITALQGVHDQVISDTKLTLTIWEEGLKEVAKEFGLSYE